MLIGNGATITNSLVLFELFNFLTVFLKLINDKMVVALMSA